MKADDHLRNLKRLWEVDAAPIPKRHAYGTHRARAPEETLAAIKPHFAALGITRIADVTGLDAIGLPVCMAVRPNSRSLAVAQGKGLTLPLARASAAMETIEHYHAEHDTLATIETTYRTLSASAEVVDPGTLPRHPLSAFHDELPLRWVAGYDLVCRKVVFVPYDIVHLRFAPGSRPLPMFRQSSTGLASGNHLLEAISHAICEVVERDATALWDLRPGETAREQTMVRLETIDSAPLQALIAAIERAELTLLVWDQTTDIGLPCYYALIDETPVSGLKKRRGNFAGYGCHLSKEIALIRAITEAAQSRLTVISGARDDMYRINYRIHQQSRLNKQYFQRLGEEVDPQIDFRELPSMATDTLDGDVALQIEHLRRAGLDQVIVVDLTNPRFDIPVVKVIVPGAEYKRDGLQHRFGKRAKEQTLRALIDRYFFKTKS